MLERVPVLSLQSPYSFDVDIQDSVRNVRGERPEIAKRGNAFDQFASALCQTLDRNGIAVANEEIERGAKLPLRRPLVQIRTHGLTN